MLVLKITKGNQVCIGDSTVLTVLGIHRTWVKLGFEAPKEVPVYRREVYEKIQRGIGEDEK